MCLAIYKPKNRQIIVKRLREAYEANPDGCGLLFSVNGNLSALKGCYDFDTFYKNYLIAISHSQDVVIHFRTASSGAISDENCHPFFVDKDLAFVENGNLFELTNFFESYQDNKTDVIRFNDRILKKLPCDFLRNVEIRPALEKYCQVNFTKMIFMESSGKVNILNEQAGEWVDGCWYSNGGIENYIGYGYSGAYYYKVSDIRHKGGRITSWLFPPSRKKNWNKCDYCKGYFYRLKGRFCGDCSIFLKLLSFTQSGQTSKGMQSCFTTEVKQ